MLITAAELSASGMVAGLITSLSFDVVSINASQPLDNYEVKIGTTALTAITAFQSGLTSVYLAPTYMPVVGANTHTLNTPFYWDGVSNLIIETCHNNGSYIDNCSFNQSTTAYTSTVYYRADALGVCGNATVTANINQRPNIVFEMLPVYDYSWTPVGSLDNALIQSPVGTPMVTTNFVVMVTDSVNGCVTSDSIPVVVNQSPAPDFGADTSICDNASLVLDGTAGTYDYLWQDNSTNQTFTVVNAAGQYNVMVTDSITGCMGADTIMVGIDIAPSFTLGADVTVCSGVNATFNGPANSNYLYTWSSGDTTMSITTGTGGSYDLTVTDSTNGCMDMDTVMLTENPLPPLALGADTTICSNVPTMTLSAPAGAYTYLWSTAASTQSISVGAGTYSVMVTDNATSCSANDTITIVSLTAPSFTLGSDTSFCSGAGFVLSGPSGPYMYMWSDSSSGMTLSVSASGTYSVDVTDSTNGCWSSDTVVINTLTTPAVTLNDTMHCGTSVVLSGPAGPYTYLWSTSGSSQTETVTSSGTYSLMVTDNGNGCTGTDSATVTLNANPTVTASAAASTVCLDDANVSLTGSPSGGTFTGTSVTGNQFDPSVGVGNFPIVYTYTDGNGCSGSDTVAIQVNACVGVNEAALSNDVNVYPNPASDVFNISFEAGIAGHVNIELFDAQGKLVSARNMENIGAGQIVALDVTAVESGLYMMKITGANTSQVYKLNVQH
jgi:hypothetical protein